LAVVGVIRHDNESHARIGNGRGERYEIGNKTFCSRYWSIVANWEIRGESTSQSLHVTD